MSECLWYEMYNLFNPSQPKHRQHPFDWQPVLNKAHLRVRGRRKRAEPNCFYWAGTGRHSVDASSPSQHWKFSIPEFPVRRLPLRVLGSVRTEKQERTPGSFQQLVWLNKVIHQVNKYSRLKLQNTTQINFFYLHTDYFTRPDTPEIPKRHKQKMFQ